jgi:hypothetical protein
VDLCAEIRDIGLVDADEQDICNYLKSLPGEFISGKEIARRAGGKWRFRKDPQWAATVLPRMVEKELLESDSTGHYRLVAKRPDDKRKKRWVSPQIKKILRESGKTFGEITQIDEDLE